MPRLTFAGHPVHPQLVSLPLGLLPMSLALDVTYLTTGRRRYAQAAYYSMLGGYVGALSAAMAGLGDYFEIPEGTATKRTANVHLTMNVGIVGLASLGLMRRRGKAKPDAVDIAMSAIGNAALLVSAWYGGQLVYRHGMRVDGRSEIAGTPEWRLPGDEQIERALAAVPGDEDAVEVRAWGDGRSAGEEIAYSYGDERRM